MGIRRKILESMYEFSKSRPYGLIDTQELRDMTGVESQKDIDNNLYFLNSEGYITDHGGNLVGEGLCDLVRITPAGIRLVESREEFNRMFPDFHPRITADDFMKVVKDNIDESEISADEKAALLSHLNAVMEHPGSADLVRRVLSQYLGQRGR